MANQLEQYILDCTAQGISKETLKDKLLAAGWNEKDIEKGLSSGNKQVQPFFIFDPSFLIRVGLAFVFSFASINFFFSPASGLHYLPQFVRDIIPAEIFLHFFEAFELILSIWLLSGKLSRYAGLVSAILLLGITALNIESLSVLFRNVAIIFGALALAVLPAKNTEDR